MITTAMNMQSLILSVALLPLCFGALYQDPSQLPKIDYDFIVVGGGTAGNVIANRLTENLSFSVLVLEAGVSDHNVVSIEAPLLCPTLASTIFDWNYTTTAQPGLDGRSIAYPRGKVLGGSSSINYLIYTRGSSDDYDRFAQYSGDQGWSWNDVQPYILKMEDFVPPQDHHNTTGQFNPAIHGTKGPVQVSLEGFTTPLDARVTQTLDEFPSEFSFNEDLNSGNATGFGWVQRTSGGGRRFSSSTAYLAPQYINKPNLDVLINAQVTRLVQTGTENGLPAFHTVEFAATHAQALVIRVNASKEIILSAGAIGTPQILMLSGIGDEDALAQFGIKTIVNLPDVGQNMSDHPLLSSNFVVNTTETFDDIFRNLTVQDNEITEWSQTREGPLVDTVTNQFGWLRLPQNASIFKTFADPSPGPSSAHYEILFSNSGFFSTPTPATRNFMSVGTVVISPVSRGYVKLHSSNPFDDPIIFPNLLGSDFDVFTMREAVKAGNRFLTGSAWKDFVIQPFGPNSNTTTDSQVDQFVRENTSTIFHPVGTASMSPKGVPYGVVDPDLLLKKASGIRIVDASVFPFIPSSHTQVPVYVFAERASDLIKHAHS